MATNLFTRAKTYRRSHPSVSQAEAVSILAAQDRTKKGGGAKSTHKKTAHKKKHTVGKAHKHKNKVAKKVNKPAKKAVARKSKKHSIKVGIKKSGIPYVTIGAVSMDKISHEHNHQAGLRNAITKHQQLLKTPGLGKGEKDQIRREIRQYRQQIGASKRHVSVLKRSI